MIIKKSRIIVSFGLLLILCTSTISGSVIAEGQNIILPGHGLSIPFQLTISGDIHLSAYVTSGPNVNFYLMDAINHQRWLDGQAFESYVAGSSHDSRSIDKIVNLGSGSYYFIIENPSLFSSATVFENVHVESLSSLGLLAIISTVIFFIIVLVAIAIVVMKRRSGNWVSPQKSVEPIKAMRCPNCGQLAPEGQPYCPKCGMKVW